jgi:hypothetical protein
MVETQVVQLLEQQILAVVVAVLMALQAAQAVQV